VLHEEQQVRSLPHPSHLTIYLFVARLHNLCLQYAISRYPIVLFRKCLSPKVAFLAAHRAAWEVDILEKKRLAVMMDEKNAFQVERGGWRGLMFFCTIHFSFSAAPPSLSRCLSLRHLSWPATRRSSRRCRRNGSAG